MKITVIGAGAIGGVIGGYLSQGGCDVTLLDIVPEHVKAMQSQGLTIITPEGDRTIPVEADTVSHFLQSAPQTLECVLLCVKAQYTTAALQPFMPLMKEDSYVLSIQNGLCCLEIAALLGRERTLCGFVNIFADYLEPGKINYGGKGALVIGELDGTLSPRLARLEVELKGLDRLASSDNVLGYLWAKLGYANVLLATSLTNETMADVIDDPRYRVLLMDLAAEVLEVAAAEGIVCPPFDDWDPADAYPRTARDLAKMNKQLDIHVKRLRTYTKVHSGIWRDIAVRHRETEMDAEFAPVFALGERHGCQLPLTRLNLQLLHEIEAGERPFSTANLEVLLQAHRQLYG